MTYNFIHKIIQQKKEISKHLAYNLCFIFNINRRNVYIILALYNTTNQVFKKIIERDQFS